MEYSIRVYKTEFALFCGLFKVGGHDSTEDAVACMELVHWKVKEEAKLQ